MKVRISRHVVAAVITAGMSLTGCGGTLYAIQVNGAAGKVAQAKEIGADKLAPYEYYFAAEHLTKAISEASEADYSDAVEFANVAEEYADKAIKLARDARRGAGR
jgi:hypothetical protein